MKKPVDFRTACTRMLTLMGARIDGKSGLINLPTRAGPMICRAHENGLECTFSHPGDAAWVIKGGRLNPYSGKWDWTFSAPGERELFVLQHHIAQVVVLPQQSRPIVDEYMKELIKLGPGEKDTRLVYQYRDASNYKVSKEIFLKSGPQRQWMPRDQLWSLMLTMDHSEYEPSIIPGQMGLPDLQDSFEGCESQWDPESDTPWHEVLSITPVPAGAGSAQIPEGQTYDDFRLGLLRAALINGWDDEYKPSFYPEMARRHERSLGRQRAA